MRMLFIIIPLVAFSYQWPMFDQYGNADNKIVISGFGAYRPYYNGMEEHFHAGIDIPEQENAQMLELYIWPIDYAIVVRITGVAPNQHVTIQHYNSQFTTPKEEGSTYRHVTAICDVGETLTLDNPVANGWDMHHEHLHLEYRVPGTLADYKNPFTITELQIEDNTAPTLCRGDFHFVSGNS